MPSFVIKVHSSVPVVFETNGMSFCEVLINLVTELVPDTCPLYCSHGNRRHFMSFSAMKLVFVVLKSS